MRYEDWDVLLFPCESGDAGHVPLQEFRTTCHLVKSSVVVVPRGEVQATAVPIVTCFVPALDANEAFQVSIHSWTKREFRFKSMQTPVGPPLVWELKTIVDGQLMCTQYPGADVSWPHVLSVANVLTCDEEALHALRFPRFYPSVLSQQKWNPADKTGRIMVTLAEGFLTGDREPRFIKIHDHVHFNFQPVPLALLKQVGIAWPSDDMRKKMLVSSPYLAPSASLHQRKVSSDSGHGIGTMSSSPFFSTPGPPPTTPTNHSLRAMLPTQQDPGQWYESSTRSTSAYSTVPLSSLPRIPVDSHNCPMVTGNDPDVATRHRVEMRIPSDQMQKLINAITTRSPPSTTSPQMVSESMPPPPLPSRASPTRKVVEPETVNMVSTDGLQTSTGAPNRRDASHSNFSDVSMHVGCSLFPACTTEDAQGGILHDSSSVPADVVRGKKEGTNEPDSALDSSVNEKSNDLGPNRVDSPMHPAPIEESSVMHTMNPSSSPSVGPHTKKRTRSGLKSISTNGVSLNESADGVSKPPRKVSRASNPDKENAIGGPDLGEPMVVDV